MVNKSFIHPKSVFVLSLFLLVFTYLITTAFTPANTKIVYEGGSGDYFSNITAAVGACSDGYSVVIYPGTYSDSNLTIPDRISFIGCGEVYWTAGDTLFILGEEGISFEGISFKATDTSDFAIMDTFRYSMKECTLRCETFDFGQDTAHFIGCHFYPKSNDGWEVTGAGTQVQLRDCKLADDMPGQPGGETAYGINVTDEGMLSVYHCNFQADSGAFYCDDGRLRIYYSMIIATIGSAIKAEGNSNVSCLYTSLEGNDNVTNQPAVKLLDTSEGHFNKCIIRNIQSEISMYTNTTREVLFIDNNFKKEVVLDEPSGGTSGDIKFIGMNSSMEGGFRDETGTPSTVYGEVINMMTSGIDVFDEDDEERIVYVNGMPSDAVVNITYKNDDPVLSGDALLATEVDGDGGFFTVYRSSTTNTDSLYFYWTARWTEED